MFSELFQILVALGDKAAVDYVDLARKIGFTGRPDGKGIARAYVGALVGITLVWIIVPLAITTVGVLLYSKWIIAISFFILAVGTVLMFLAAAPIGVFIDLVFGGSFGAGYSRGLAFVLTSELMVSLILMLFKVTNYSSSLPVIVVASMLIAIISASGIGQTKGGRRLTRLLVSVVLISMLSFVLPQTFDAAGTFIRWGDYKMAGEIRKPDKAPLPTGGLTTDPAELHSAVVQAQQEQMQVQTQTSTSQRGQVSTDASVFFKEGDVQKLVALQPGVWSPEIITPPTKIARIDVPYGQTVYVLFSGNSVPVKMTEGKPMNIGTVAKSVFRLYSETGTMATVTVDKGS